MVAPLIASHIVGARHAACACYLGLVMHSNPDLGSLRRGRLVVSDTAVAEAWWRCRTCVL